MTGYGTSDAVARETAWLSVGLVKSGVNDTSAPFDVVQAYWPGDLDNDQRGVYVMRTRISVIRDMGQESYARYPFRLRVLWPLLDQAGAEVDQLNFDGALDLLLARIVGPQLDKTHGGQFLSVAGIQVGSTPAVDVQIDPADQLITAGRPLSATVTYVADDREQYV